MGKAIAAVHAALDFKEGSPPSFQNVLYIMEAQDIPDQEARDQYASTRITEIANRHAHQFFTDHLETEIRREFVMLENVEGAMREAIEEVIGETRQKPTKPPPLPLP